MDENLRDSMYEMYDECIDGEFCSRWKYPEEEIEDMIDLLEDKDKVYIRILTFQLSLLEDKDKVYIRILTFQLSDEYVSFRVFSEGEWKTAIETLPCVI